MEHELNAMDLFLEPRSEGDELLRAAFSLASAGALEQLQALLVSNKAAGIDCGGLVNGFTMAHVAAKKGHERTFAFLLDSFPALRDAPTQDGRLAIHLAAYEGHCSILQLLCDRGASTEATDSNGHTALHFACWSGHLECARFLVKEMGADVSARTNEQMTALQFASAGNHLEVVKFLEGQSTSLCTINSGNGQTSLHKACMFGSLKTVQHLIQNNPDLGTLADVHGNNALHVASAHGYTDVVNYLLEHTDISVSQGNHVEQTALHRACAGAHVKVVRALVDNGADPHQRDGDGHTALHHAAAVGDAATIKFLCRHCDVMIEPESNDNSTPIDLALQAGFKEAASLIAKQLAVSMRADKLRSNIRLFSPYFEKKQASVVAHS